MDVNKLIDIFEGSQDGDPLEEILFLTEKICPLSNLALLREIHSDVRSFFSGTSPKFQKNRLPYHNLRHSQMVVLASTRLFHGLHCNKVHISEQTLFKGQLAAYFHDSGMLLEQGDPAQSATKYLEGHEARSIQFLKNYVVQKKLGDEIVNDCAIIINYTNLEKDPANFPSHNHHIQIAGQVIGSADILAQMADRYYLECLPLLFDEQATGGINRHNSALELMEHTAKFYHEVVLKRLTTTLSNTSEAMRIHFRERYKIDRNLYSENIDKNIIYLKSIITKCDDIGCLEKYLKRNPPTA